MAKNQAQTVTTAPDQATQNYVNQMRNQASQAAGQIGGGSFFGGPTQPFMQGVQAMQDPMANLPMFMDPYQADVIKGVQTDFDRQRQMALQSGAQQATAAGAWGGDRSAILQAQMANDVNRNEAATLAGLRSQGFGNALNFGLQRSQGLLGAGLTLGQLQDQVRQNPIFAANAAQGLFQGGLGPYGQMQSQPLHSNLGGSMLGGGLSGASIGSSFGVPGALIGGGIGALGGLFGGLF